MKLEQSGSITKHTHFSLAACVFRRAALSATPFFEEALNSFLTSDAIESTITSLIFLSTIISSSCASLSKRMSQVISVKTCTLEAKASKCSDEEELGCRYLAISTNLQCVCVYSTLYGVNDGVRCVGRGSPD